MTLVIAVNYGSRAEILEAAQRSIDEALAALAEGKQPEPLTEAAFESRLYTAIFPTPTCSSAHRARCASRTSCSGRSPIRNSISPTCSGQISTAMNSCVRCCITSIVIAVSGRCSTCPPSVSAVPSLMPMNRATSSNRAKRSLSSAKSTKSPPVEADSSKRRSIRPLRS